MNIALTHNRNTIVFDGFVTTHSYLAELKEDEQHDKWIHPSFLDSKVQPPNKARNEYNKTLLKQEEDEDNDDESYASSESSECPIPWVIHIPTRCIKTLSTLTYNKHVEFNIPIDDECSSVGMSTQDSEDYEEELSETARWERLAGLFHGNNLEMARNMSAPVANDEPNWGNDMSFHEYCQSMGLGDSQPVASAQTETTCHYYFPEGLLDA